MDFNDDMLTEIKLLDKRICDFYSNIECALRTEQQQHAKGVLLPCALQTFQFFHCRKDAEKIRKMVISARWKCQTRSMAIRLAEVADLTNVKVVC